MLEHCRPTVERYVFGKLHDKLFSMYKLKNEVEDLKFEQVSVQMKARDQRELIKFLGVRDKLIFGSDKPYQGAIREIEKIQHYDNPSEMV